ncbi:hypothetical protein GJAV_G00063300 [Gymnothorax javanicus]|nr:hypothetical protein GJAV_G00063300 [Gymnothorax javanicus]
MTYANDKLYDGFIRNEMGRIGKKVRVCEILPYLPCLTQSDRDEINAKDNVSGNSAAMPMLLDYLKRRRNWPDQFIRALEICEHWELANEIRAEYKLLLSPRNAAAAPAANAFPIQASDTGPPSHPALQYLEMESQLPQPGSQPVTNSGEQNSVSVSSEVPVAATPSQILAAPSGQSLPGRSSQEPVSNFPSLPLSIPPASDTNSPRPAIRPSEPPMSSVKPPVQESDPPVSSPVHLPVENSCPKVPQFLTKVAASNHLVQGSSPHQSTRLMTGANPTDSPCAPSLPGGPINDELLSRPRTLLFCNPMHLRPTENQALLAAVNEELYSGDSARLQFSSSFQESQASSGITVRSLNEPEEDHYESIQRSLLNQDVRFNVGHVSEDPSLLNHAGQALQASDEQPSHTPLLNPSEPEAESTTTGPEQQPSNQQRGFPYNMLKNYYVSAAAVAGLSAIVLWRLRN